MAEKRMLAKSVIWSDEFLDMPATSQMLYMHLSMAADDDGFVNGPKKIQRMCGAMDDDLKMLIMKGFIIAFESGIIVMKHWKLNNNIQKDRYKPTIYTCEFAMLRLQKNKEYSLDLHGPDMDTQCIQSGYNMDTQCIQSGYNMDTQCIQSGYSMDTQDRIDQVRIDQINPGEGEVDNTIKYRLKNESLTVSEYQSLISKYPKIVVDKIINSILTHPYSSCLNYQTISEWAAKTPKQKQNKGGRAYNYDDLEAQLLAAQPIWVPR